MEIKDKTIQNTILDLFKKKGVTEPENTNIQAFLKENPDKTYIKLYYGDNKIVLSENYATDDYWTIKKYIKDELKHNPEKDLTSFTLDDLDKLPDEVKDEMKHIWFSADFHHGHRAMAESLWDGINRPTNIDTHTDWLINDVINKHVGKKDKFFIIGDLSLAPRKEAEKFINKLNGDKVLIIGNHDGNIKNSTVISEKTQIKDFKYNRHGISINIILCHYPMMTWSRSVHGSWHLYGHVHGRLDHPRLAFDVGIDHTDMNHMPINLWEVAIKMVKKKNQMDENLGWTGT